MYATLTYYLAHQGKVDAGLARLRHRNELDYLLRAEDSPPGVKRLRAFRESRARS